MIASQITSKSSSTEKPILVTDCAKIIRSAQGKIWMIECRDFGTQLRANVSGRNVRVIVKPLNGTAHPIPDESNSTIYKVDSLDGLRIWLSQFSTIKNG
jgi:hypothetical protein